MKIKKKLLLTLLVLITLMSVFAFPVTGRAEDAVSITVPFYSVGMGDYEYRFPYSDSFFDANSSVFSRNLAKASMGLLVSAFRNESESEIRDRQEVYLSGAGFQDIYKFGYDRPTGVDTLSGIIGQKQMGDYTLIAASPAGQGYEKEWGGNLQLGKGVRHEGFQTGAQILEDQVYEYLKEHQITGKIRIWLAGFSRAAAVCNLAAADFIESERFEDVYAYLFGVPRTTKEPVAYDGIYNICGQFDPIPMVPLESWGYGRYGQDLYTPAEECDIHYISKMGPASEASMDITGDFFRYNPVINYQIHLILEFLGELFPSGEEYTDKMQDVIMRIWQEPDQDNIPEILSAVFSQLDELDSRQEESRGVIIEYLTYILSLQLQKKKDTYDINSFFWAEDQSISTNLMREHMPYIYMSWVFSDNSDEAAFHGPTETRRVFVLGDVDVEVWMGDQYLTGLDQKADVISHPENMNTKGEIYDIFITKHGEETQVCLPTDTSFRLLIRTDQREAFAYFDMDYSAGKTGGNLSDIKLAVKAAGVYTADFPARAGCGELKDESGRTVSVDYIPAANSPTTVMKMESASGEHFSIFSLLGAFLVLILYVVLLFLVCLILFIVHAVRKKKHGPYSPWFVIVPHVLLIIPFTALTIYVTSAFYAIPLARIISAAISMLILFLLSLRGLIRNRNLPNLLITVGILLLGVINCLVYQKSMLVSSKTLPSILYCAGIAVLTALAVWTFRKEKGRYR